MSCNNDEELWRYALEETAEISLSKCMLDEGRENEGFPFCFYDGTTPVKDCGDLVVNDINPCERPVSLHNKIKEGLVGESSLQVKRRRTLLFEPEVLDAPVCNEVMQDAQAINGVISELPQWVSDGVTDNSFEALDLSDEEWVAKFLNDTEMNLSSEKIDTSETSGSPVCQVTELDNIPSPSEAVVHDQFVGRRQNVVFKGRKSFMRAPSKSPASVVYPFDFIKPSDLRGDVTLKDINQKIRTPPPKPKSPSVRYPKSAFSGKPVVGKTKICMEGGKGSITIMRTMG